MGDRGSEPPASRPYSPRRPPVLPFLRLSYTFRSAIFFKFRLFGLSHDPNEIYNVIKKSLKKITY